jgi:small-conductance mechanosensitive channel
MAKWLDFFKSDLSHSIAFTVILLVVVGVSRSVLARRIKGNSDILTDAQRQSLSMLGNYTVSITIVLFILIWAVQLKSFALSLAAFAVAIVLAFKEVILCLSGSIVIASGTRSFKIGDWIEIGNYRGEVIGHNPISTTLQEVSAKGNHNFTGKTLVIPNSIYLVHSLANLNFNKKYVFQTIEILAPEKLDWKSFKDKLSTEVNKIAQPFLGTAKEYNKLIEKKSGMDMPDVDPVIRLKSGDEGKIYIAVKLFCPRDKVETIEHQLVEMVLANK